MNKQEFTGKNIEEALDAASQAFSTEKSLIRYRLIPVSSGNIFTKLFSRSVKIEAWVETTTTDLQAAAREAVRQALGKAPASHAKETNLSTKPARKALTMNSSGAEELFRDYTHQFMKSFGVENKSYDIQIEADSATVHVKDEHMENLLVKSDKLSLSFEHVFKRIAQKKLGDISSRICLNAGNALDKREDHLIEMAKSLAEKVLKSGKSVTLSSKSSQERRIIHLTLESYKGILTKSIGTGSKRKLIIYLANSPAQREARTHQRPPRRPQGNDGQAGGSEQQQRPRPQRRPQGSDGQAGSSEQQRPRPQRRPVGGEESASSMEQQRPRPPRWKKKRRPGSGERKKASSEPQSGT